MDSDEKSSGVEAKGGVRLDRRLHVHVRRWSRLAGFCGSHRHSRGPGCEGVPKSGLASTVERRDEVSGRGEEEKARRR